MRVGLLFNAYMVMMIQSLSADHWFCACLYERSNARSVTLMNYDKLMCGMFFRSLFINERHLLNAKQIKGVENMAT